MEYKRHIYSNHLGGKIKLSRERLEIISNKGQIIDDNGKYYIVNWRYFSERQVTENFQIWALVFLLTN